MKATPVGSLHCLYTFQKAISSPLRETPLPKRITKRHKQRKTNNAGAQQCVRPKYTQAKKLPDRHTGLPLHKAIRHKNRKTNNVGAHRCVRQKYTQAMRNRTDTPVCPYGKKNE